MYYIYAGTFPAADVPSASLIIQFALKEKKINLFVFLAVLLLEKNSNN
jgi:hypothetical protein